MEHEMPETDEELFTRYKTGDESAFDELHTRYAGPIGRYIATKSRVDAMTCDEMVQAVFVRVVRNRDRFEADRKVKPWLYTIADRIARDHRKVSQRRAKHFTNFSDATSHLSVNENTEESIVEEYCTPDSRQRRPDEALEESEMAARAMRLLRNLPVQLRSMVQMSVIRGIPSRAAGPLMQMSHAWSQTRLRMALDILRKQLESGEDCEVTPTEVGTISDLLELIPASDRLAIERVIFDESKEPNDCSVFATFIRRSLGEVV
jgi:RNA polymerase sigma factor (sigma-70 family)